MFACIFGTYYEQVLKLIADGVWVTQQGVIYGHLIPFMASAAGLIALLVRKKENGIGLFCLPRSSRGFEYLLHELEYIFTGNVSWDYTYLKLYIPSIVTKGATAGTSVLPMAIWGRLGCFWNI